MTWRIKISYSGERVYDLPIDSLNEALALAKNLFDDDQSVDQIDGIEAEKLEE